MARPIKDGVSYWPFDVDMLGSRKFKLIRAEFGIKGAYIALVILSSVYKDNGYYKRWDDDDCLLMSEDVGDGCTPQLVRAVLLGCVRRGLFDESRFKMFGILTSAGIQRRFLHMVKNSRDKIIFIKEYLLIDLHDQGLSEGVLNKVVLKTGFPEENPHKTEGNPHKTEGNPRKKKEKEIEREIEREIGASAPRTRFTPPSVDEVKAYCEERNNAIDPQRFVDYYTANGWVQGKGKPIKDWKACVRTWEQRNKSSKSEEAEPANSEYEQMVQSYVPSYKKKKR